MAFVPTQTPTPLLPIAIPDAGAPSGPFAAPEPFATASEDLPTGDPRDAFAALLASIVAPASPAPAAVERVARGQIAQAPGTTPPSPETVLDGLQRAIEAIPAPHPETGPVDPAAPEAALQPAGSPFALPADRPVLSTDQPVLSADDSVTPPVSAPSPAVEPAVATEDRQIRMEGTARTVPAAPLAQAAEAAPPAELTDETGEARKAPSPETRQAGRKEQVPALRSFAATGAADVDPAASPPVPAAGTSAPERAGDSPSDSDADEAAPATGFPGRLQETRKAVADQVAADIVFAPARAPAQSDATQAPQPLPARSDAAPDRGPLETALASADRMVRAPTAGGDAGLGTAGGNATPQAAAQTPQAAPQAPGGAFAALVGPSPQDVNADRSEPSALRMTAASDSTATSPDPLAGLKSLSLTGGTAPQPPQQTGAAAQPPAPSTHLPPHTPAVPVSLGIAKALTEGHRRITVRLDPPELGRVEVRLDFAGDGTVKAFVRADNHHTLDLLQRDSRLLERALTDSGLKADSGSLNFSLNQGSQNGAGFADGSNGDRNGGGSASGASAPELIEASEEEVLEQEFTGTAHGGVNLVI